LKITDLRASFAVTKEAGLISIIDNTFLTPYFQHPIELDVGSVVPSAT